MAPVTNTLTAPPPRAGTAERLPPLENGDRLDRATFHARYAAMPPGTRAELIGGRVYLMASPVFIPHGRPHSRVAGWLLVYQAATPGTDTFDNTSAALGNDSEPQPDSCLLVLPEYGGRASTVGDRMIEGSPELVVEVASSSASYDLHEKRTDYERYGVQEYVVYAVRAGLVSWWVRRGNGYDELPPGPDGILRSEAFPGLWLDAAALIRNDSAVLLAALQRGLASPEHAAFVAALASKRQSP